MEKKSAWIYCHIDAPEDNHGALKGQYESLETYAAQMGFMVVGFSQDLGSGRNLERSGLQTVLEAAKTGSFQVLLVDSMSRIAWDAGKVQVVINSLHDCGVSLYSSLEGKLDESFQSGTVSQEFQ